MAVLMNAPQKEDWKACDVGAEEEAKMKASFRRQFEPFDLM